MPDIDSWYRARAYKHFDVPCSLECAREASSPEFIHTRSFYPLIQRERISRRYVCADNKTPLKVRKVAYAAHVDAHIYARYAAYLSERYEIILADKGLGKTAIAYRKLGVSNVGLSLEALGAACALKPRLLLGFDLDNFFGTLRHSTLKKAWLETLGASALPDDHYAVFKSLTRYAFVDRKELIAVLGARALVGPRLCSAAEFRSAVRPLIQRNKTPGIGIPQGLPISACLSNIYMLSFDEAMRNALQLVGGTYVRYSDDILLSLPATDELRIVDLMRALLHQLGLSINDSKTMRRVAGEDGIFEETSAGKTASYFDYLGLSYDGTDVTLRQKTLARFHQKMSHAVHKAERESRRLGSDRLLFGRGLIAQFSHRGDRNFVRGYALKAAAKFGLTKIRAQLARHAQRLRRLMTEADLRLRCSTANQGDAKATHVL